MATQRTVLLILFCSFIVLSCSWQDEPNPTQLADRADAQLKTAFAKGLSQALVAEKPVRDFIKTEALNMIDGDYDVLYSLVKHKTLTNGKSLEATLAPYFEEIGLENIEAGLPLLTMFVPTLPENSFSAELWDTQNDIPFVAIVKNGKNTEGISVLSPEGEWGKVERHLIPSFPVVVIKNNERMVYNGQSGYEDSKATRTFETASGKTYKFVDDVFDNELQIEKKSNTNQRTVTSVQIDPKLVTAYNTYLNVDGWQRDQIYYDITTSTPNGTFKYDFQEHIRTFRISNADGKNMYYILADGSTGYNQGDPTLWQIRRTGWTDGFYEFFTQTHVLGRNGVGSIVSNSAWITGSDLFDYTYRIEKRASWPNRYDYYFITSMTGKEKSINLPIVPWDLQNYSTTFKVEIEEVDNTTTIIATNSVSSEFATNFGYDASIGPELAKIGVKFGFSSKETKTATVQTITTLGSEKLGSVAVNFADKVIISSNRTDPNPANWTYAIREYDNATFSISVEPKRVQ